MTFPLTPNPVSAALEFVSRPHNVGVDIDMVMDVPVTRTTKWGVHNVNGISIFRVNRSVPIAFMNPAGTTVPLAVDIKANFHHTFVGIGGVRYIPSFPQLDRNTTTFPHAY